MDTAPLMADDSKALICPRWPPMTFTARRRGEERRGLDTPKS